MNQLTNRQLKDIHKPFKSKVIEWNFLNWDSDDHGEPRATYYCSDFEFENENFYIRADVSVLYEHNVINIEVNNLTDVYYGEDEQFTVTNKQAGIILYHCNQHLTDNF